jgi:predicted permease
MFEDIFHDLRYAVRTLGRSPGLVMTAIFSLAIGIGVNAAIFSVVNAVFLRPLPYPDPDQLMLLTMDIVSPDGRQENTVYWSYPYYRDFTAATGAFETAAAFTPQYDNLVGLEEAQRVRVELVTASYFDLLGARVELGQAFAVADDEERGRASVAVLSDGAWKRLFGADPEVLGRTVALEDTQVQIIGVMASGFQGLSGEIDIWVPFALVPELAGEENLENPHWFWHRAVGRLRPGVSLAGTEAEFTAIGRSLKAEYGDQDEMTPRPVPLLAAHVDPSIRSPLGLLQAAVGFVLLIACANVASLLLSRALARSREIGMRVALGARPARLVRQLLAEGLLLGMVGGLAGMLLGVWLLRALEPALPPLNSEWTNYALVAEAPAIDVRVLAFTMGLAVVSAVIFSLAPALTLLRIDPRSAIAGLSQGLRVGRRAAWRIGTRHLLVVSQIALALVLVAGAGLMIRTLHRMRTADPGFDGTSVLTARFQLNTAHYPDGTKPFYLSLVEQLDALPGVERASLATSVPYEAIRYGTALSIDGVDSAWDDFSANRYTRMHVVERDFFDLLGIRLLRGRLFDERDREGAPDSTVINRTLAESFFPGQDPIGRRLGLGMGRGGRDWFEIIGVVDDARFRRVDEEVEPEAYVSYRQTSPSSIYVYVRTTGNPDQFAGRLREVARELDPNAPMYGFRTLDEVGASSRSRTRFLTLLLGGFGGVALLLAATGIYGVMAFVVTGRTRELGIRKALGATRANLVHQVLRDGLVLTALGASVGLLASGFLGRYIESQLWGVEVLDPLTLVGAALGLALVAMAAAYVPARRAARSDPLVALRTD